MFTNLIKQLLRSKHVNKHCCKISKVYKVYNNKFKLLINKKNYKQRRNKVYPKILIIIKKVQKSLITLLKTLINRLNNVNMIYKNYNTSVKTKTIKYNNQTRRFIIYRIR